MSVAASLSQEVFGSIQSCHRDLNWKLLVPTEFNISKHDARQEAQGRNVRHTILAESGIQAFKIALNCIREWNYERSGRRGMFFS